MFNIIRTRRGRLEDKLFNLKLIEAKDIEQVISVFNDFEKDNINTIEKLKRGKKVELKKINGALRQTINAHGPITMELIGSASKRIYGAMMDNVKVTKQPYKRLVWYGIVIFLILLLTLMF
jgi:hypothetical protein